MRGIPFKPAQNSVSSENRSPMAGKSIAPPDCAELAIQPLAAHVSHRARLDARPLS